MDIRERIKKMFTKKETLEQDFYKTNDINKLGINAIAIDKDTEIMLTPHNLMYLAYMVVELHPEIFSSYKQYVNFFVGKGIKSANPAINKKIDNLKTQLEVKKAVWNYLITGNVYAQKFYDEQDVTTTILKGNKLRAFNIIRDSSRIAYNFDAKDDKEYWKYFIHYTGGQMIGQKLASFTFIKYALSQISNLGTAKYSTSFGKDEITHLRSPFGRNEYYGHSTLMSGWGYARSLKEMIDNIFRISKYRAVGKKIVQLGSDDQSNPVTIKEQEELEQKFFSEEKDILFINKPVKIMDLTYSGQYDTMQNELDYVRKSLMSGSIPTFLTAFASDFNNRSLGDDSFMGFFIDLENDRELILHWFNDLFCELFDIKTGDAQLFFEGAKTFEDVKTSDVGGGDAPMDVGDETPKMTTTIQSPSGSETTEEPIPEE